MALVRGDKLKPAARALVLASFGYRWTVENYTRARSWHGKSHPTMEPVSDAEWLATHAFAVTRTGELDQRHGRCYPSYMAEAMLSVESLTNRHENDAKEATEAVKHALRDWQRSCRVED